MENIYQMLLRKIIKHIVGYMSLFSILVSVISCDKGKKGDDEATMYAKNCIPFYVEPETFKLNKSRNNGSEPAVFLIIDGNQIDEKSNREKYNLLAKKYGDVEFDNQRALESDGAISVAIDSISVISDADIDDSHPKGTELSDIVKLNTRSFYRYIKSGYKESQDQYSDKDKLISEYTKEDFTLLFYNRGLVFHFDDATVIKGTHNLTITVFFEDGKKISTLQTLKFNQ
ncbi:MAG: hypothetical protein J6X12_01515 [Paludibacteraceae bacterium]|nr:hypothetical protein [Paludibacteraceae bacterium]